MVRKGSGGEYKALPQPPTKQESDRLRGEGDRIKLIGFRLVWWQLVGFWKEAREDILQTTSSGIAFVAIG